MVNYLTRNTDKWVIGRVLGASELGIYMIAYQIMLLPVQLLAGVVNRALFPLFSRLQGKNDALASAYCTTTCAVALVSAPLMLGLFVIRETVVQTLLGESWTAVAELLIWLAPIGLLQSVGATVGSVYLATGRTDLMFRWGLVGSFVISAAFVVGIHWGLQGLLIAYALALTGLFIPSLSIPLRLIGLPVGRALAGTIPILIAATCMATLLAILDHYWQGGVGVIRLCAMLATGAIAYIFVIHRLDRKLLTQLCRAILLK
jgi:PST family polysaccharide transporter